jgi:diguanylate cyclase (GGDEF)-like protein/putative nucleotidyltransferase with HDIG domain
MGFSGLPRKAQIYLCGVILMGAVAAFAVMLCTWPGSRGTHVEICIFFLMALVLGGKKIKLFRHIGNDDAVSMSLGFVITFAGMLRFGPTGAFTLGALSCLSGCLFPKRQPLYQLLFNVALSALEAFLGSLAFLVLNGWTMEMRPLETFLAVTGATLVYFGVNTGGVSVVIGLCSVQKPATVWKETFLWTAPSYFAGACLSGLCMVLFGSSFWFILLFVTPVAYLTYQSYAVYSSRTEEKIRHAEELSQQHAKTADLYLATIKSLALAIDAKDQYTHQHILRVQRYAVAIAIEMGLTGGDLEAVNTGALLHDIGKLGVPEYVLLKPGRLTEDEFAKIKKHPEIGAAILDPVEFPWPVLPIVKYHHEKWDGSGYPEGLKGEDIPLNARIMAVADVYDALTSTRSYRNAWTHDRAFQVICKDAGTHFDPVVVDAFKNIIEGVIQEMAEVGEGPLVDKLKAPEPVADKTAFAAREISRTSSELWALYEVAQTLSASLGLKDTLDILARKLESVFPGTTCLFLLADEKKEKLEVRAAVGPNHEFFTTGKTINVYSRSLKVSASGETFVGEYDHDDLVFSSPETAQWTDLRSTLIVPIVHHRQTLGTINMYHPAAAAFSHHDMQTVETVAERIAMALFNGLLFDRAHSLDQRDPITGAYNFSYLAKAVEERCQTDERFALLCLDLENFKAINDNFGYDKGDQVLCAVARLIRITIGAQDVVARYGGDEFLILLKDADEAAALSTAQLLETALSEYDAGLVHFKLGDLTLVASMGVASYPQDGTDCTALLAKADSMLHQDKTERKLQALADPETRKPRRKKAA